MSKKPKKLLRLSSAVKAAITRYAGAVDDYAFRGTLHPDDQHDVDYHYHEMRRRLEATILRFAESQRNKQHE